MLRSEFFLCVLFLCTDLLCVLSPPIHSIIIPSFGFKQFEEFCTCGMSYRWFQGFDWDGLRQRTLVCPIVQQVSTKTSCPSYPGDATFKYGPERFCSFADNLQANAGIVTQFRPDYILPYSF